MFAGVRCDPGLIRLPVHRYLFQRQQHLGFIAQLVEHLPCKEGVAGSIPAGSTIVRQPRMGRT